MQQFINTTFKKIAPLAILLMAFFSAGAQKHGQALIDSLTAALPVAKNDTVKVRLLKSIAEQYLLVNFEKEYVRGGFHNNTIEGFWSQLKRTIKGTHIHVSRKHLQKYVDEVAFRYEQRKNQDTMFETILSHII